MALCSGLQILCFFLSQVTLGMTSEITQSHLPCHRDSCVPKGRDELGLGLRCLFRVYGAVSPLLLWLLLFNC